MRKHIIAVSLALVIAVSAGIAQARSGSSTSSGSHSSSGKHVPAGTYIERKCKTEACFKKHPSGHYGFVSGQRKRKTTR